MRKICIIVTGIFLTFLFTACKQFNANMEEYLSYWSAEVSPASHTIDKTQQTNGKGILCISSADDAAVTINLRNPQNFRLVMPNPPSTDAGKVIRFPGFPSNQQPNYNTDYTLTQTANDKLELTYKSAFLQRHEWGTRDIGPEITFIAADGRVFRRKFSLNLKVDTAPALEYAGIGKTAVGSDDYYVLLFRVKDMGTMIGGQSVHKDINTMNITVGGITLSAITLNVTGSDFTPDGNLLAADAVQKLKPTDPELPTGNGLLRLKTDVKVGGPEKVYEVCIKDKQGLSSAVIRASTKKNKLADVKLFDGSSQIGASAGAAGTEETNAKAFPGISGKTLTAQAQNGAAITGKIEKKTGSEWNPVGSAISGTTSVSISLPVLDSGQDESLYKITVKAALSGYVDSEEKEFFVKLLRQELPVLKLKQDFSSGDVTLHCISAAAKGYVSEDIIPDAVQYTAADPLVIYDNASGTSTAKLEVSASAGTTIEYKLNTAGPVQLSTTPATISLSGTGVQKLEIWAGVAGSHTTVHFKVENAVDKYSQLKNVVKNTPEKGTGTGQYNYTSPIDISIGDNLTASADTEIAVTGGKKLILQSSLSSPVRTVNANNSGRIFKISGSGTKLTLKDIKLEGGNAADGKGGAACVEDNGSLELVGGTVITPSAGADKNTKGKNDVYLANGANIGVNSGLTSSDPIVARITPADYNEGITVLTGTTIGSDYTRFSVTQPTGSTDNIWTIKNDGTLAAISKTITGGTDAWKTLRELVRIAPADTVITIDGTIQSTSASGNNGEILIDKDLTIQGKTGAASDILNADKDAGGKPKHRIFKVEAGKTLTLQNLTLTGGVAEGTGEAGFGGGVYANGGTVNITNCTVKGNSAKNGGGVYVKGAGATLTMSGGKISANKAVTDPSAPSGQKGGAGGGIFIATGAKLTISGGTVGGSSDAEGNSAAIGGGIYLMDNGAKAEMTGGSITHNKAGKSGGGVYISDYNSNPRSLFTLKGGIISYNTAKNGGGITAFGDFNMDGGSIEENTAIGDPDPSLNLGTGGGIDLVAATMNMTGGEIKNNHAKRGGGVSIGLSGARDAVFNMSGGTISGNTITDPAGGDGAGVEFFTESTTHSGTTYYTKMKMSGSAKVDVNNDVYVNDSRMITVDGTLTPAGGIAAVITPKTYVAGRQVLEAGTGVNLASEAGKFAVTPKVGENWRVGSDGKLHPETVSISSSATDKWKRLKDAVRDVADGGTIVIEGLVQSTSASGNNGEIVIDKDLTIQGKNGADSDILDANKGAFTDKNDKHRIFHVKDGKQLTLKKLTLKNGAVGNKAAAGGYGTRGGGILLKSGTVSLSDVTLSGCKAITDSGEGGLHGNGAGIYVVSGDIIMENTTLSENNADAYGGAVYLKGGTLTMKGSTVVTESSGGDPTKRSKNDVRLAEGAKIIVDGTLTGTGTVARITMAYGEYLPTRQVLRGTAVASNNTKFVVTNQELGTDNHYSHVRKWKIKSDGYLQSEEVTLDGSKTRAWQALKDAVRTASDGDVIAISGEVKATNEGTGSYINSGEIVIDKNITIKAKSGTATLNANCNYSGSPPPGSGHPTPQHRIFNVKAGKTLTLQNLTLKNGKAQGTGDAGLGGAIFVKGATVNITNCTLTGNEARNYGGAIYCKESTLTLDNTTIGGTAGGDNTAAAGGGIYLTGAGASGEMKNNCTISYNKANGYSTTSFQLFPQGAGIYIGASASFTMKDGSIDHNTSASTTQTANGGGVFISGNGFDAVGTQASFTMENGAISNNTAGISTYAGYGGGVGVKDGGVFTMTGGAISNNEVFKGSGGGVSVHGVMTMTGGTIEQNQVRNGDDSNGGGGIFLWYGVSRKPTLKMTGGIIKNNTIHAQGMGKGVRVNSGTTITMEMSGTAKIDTSDDVYLHNDTVPANSAFITVTGALTNNPAARLTMRHNALGAIPGGYNVGRAVVKGTSSYTLTTADVSKFTVTQQQSIPAQNWKVVKNGNAGELRKDP